MPMAAECDLPQLQAEDAVAETERDVSVAVIALYEALGGVPADLGPRPDNLFDRRERDLRTLAWIGTEVKKLADGPVSRIAVNQR